MQWRHESRRSEKAMTVKFVQTSTPRTDTIPYEPRAENRRSARCRSIATPLQSESLEPRTRPGHFQTALGQLFVLNHGKILPERRSQRSGESVRCQHSARHLQFHQVPTAPRRSVEAPGPSGHCETEARATSRAVSEEAENRGTCPFRVFAPQSLKRDGGPLRDV